MTTTYDKWPFTKDTANYRNIPQTDIFRLKSPIVLYYNILKQSLGIFWDLKKQLGLAVSLAALAALFVPPVTAYHTGETYIRLTAVTTMDVFIDDLPDQTNGITRFVPLGQIAIIDVFNDEPDTTTYDLTFETFDGSDVMWECDDALGWNLMGSDGTLLHITGWLDSFELKTWKISLFASGVTPTGSCNASPPDGQLVHGWILNRNGHMIENGTDYFGTTLQVVRDYNDRQFIVAPEQGYLTYKILDNEIVEVWAKSQAGEGSESTQIDIGTIDDAWDLYSVDVNNGNQRFAVKVWDSQGNLVTTGACLSEEVTLPAITTTEAAYSLVAKIELVDITAGACGEPGVSLEFQYADVTARRITGSTSGTVTINIKQLGELMATTSFHTMLMEDVGTWYTIRSDFGQVINITGPYDMEVIYDGTGAIDISSVELVPPPPPPPPPVFSEEWQYIKHDRGTKYSPYFTITKQADNILIGSDTGLKKIGEFILLQNFNKTDIDGQTLNVTWAGDTTLPYSPDNWNTWKIMIWDGSYNVSSSSDFPNNEAMTSKGAGLMQFIYRNNDFSTMTDSFVIDLSESQLSQVSVMVVMDDAETDNKKHKMWLYSIGIGEHSWIFDTNSTIVAETSDYGKIVSTYTHP